MTSWSETSDLLRIMGFEYQSSRLFRQNRNGIYYYAQRVTTKKGQEEWLELRAHVRNVDELGFNLNKAVAKYNKNFGGLALMGNELSINYRLLIADLNHAKITASFGLLTQNAESFAVSLSN